MVGVSTNKKGPKRTPYGPVQGNQGQQLTWHLTLDCEWLELGVGRGNLSPSAGAAVAWRWVRCAIVATGGDISVLPFAGPPSFLEGLVWGRGGGSRRRWTTDKGRSSGRLHRSGESREEVVALGCALDGSLT